MKTITLNDNHIAHLNAKNTTKLEYLNLSNNNLLPTNDIDQLISSKHLWHVLVNGINNDPLAQMQYWSEILEFYSNGHFISVINYISYCSPVLHLCKWIIVDAVN